MDAVSGAAVAPRGEMNLLLVSRSPQWAQAVDAAAEEIGGLLVSRCGARDALTRLAGTAEQYSHLLVEQDSSDGLLDALVDLTAETPGLDTEMLILGPSAVDRPHIGVIRSSNPSSVREALTLRPPVGNTQRAMHLTELRDALARSMIETRYQPIVRMADRRPIALEALARLNHPTWGIVLPDRFVPQIENAGLAATLTDLVAARSFADMTGPSLAGRGLGITLNFPLDVLLMPEALARLEVQRLASGVPADRIMIELTESRPADDFAALRRSLEQLRAAGYRVAVDDVGPGVPDLDQLLRLPFTSLKLDKDLVRQVVDHSEATAFLQRTIDAAHAHGMQVVAEGIESPEIWHRMQSLGSDAAQGFLMARPLPVAAVPVWLEAWQPESWPSNSG
jgi:EAL domain-containing protein (putative c-di-GMP-specific phosphodiesterase class I)